MAIKNYISDVCGAVFVVGSGTLTNADMLDSVIAVRADDRLVPDMATMCDFTAVDIMDVTPEGVRDMVAYMSQTRDRRDHAKTAIVVQKAGMAIMADLFAFSSSSAGLNQVVQLFQTAREALDWLNIPVEDYAAETTEKCYDKCSGM